MNSAPDVEGSDTTFVFGGRTPGLRGLPASGPYLELATSLVVAWATRNKCKLDDLSEMVGRICDQLMDFDFDRAARLEAIKRRREGLVETVDAGDDPDRLKPAVPVAESVNENYIICLEDGRRLRMLKRYLKGRYGMTPDEYRLKWGLPRDYPMSCAAVSSQRAAVAKANLLGIRGKKSGGSSPANKEGI